MKAVLAYLRWILTVGVLLIAASAALIFYFIYSPAPAMPNLSGNVSRHAIDVGGRQRSFLAYIPRGLPKGAPLVVVMHGSGQDGEAARSWTGYGFERLADAHGFAVVFPDGFEGHWNACNIVGDYAANRLNIDDVEFLVAVADSLIAEIGSDPDRVFAAGTSRGGQMAFRLALEAPARFRAVAAVSASVPTPDNFKCRPSGNGTSSVLILNGTKDPLVPFNGGEVRLFGLFRRGKVRSSPESGQYFAELNGIPGPPETHASPPTDKFPIEKSLWMSDGKAAIELVAVRGGGHGMPQPHWRNPRVLGPTASTIDGPEIIWDFFEHAPATSSRSVSHGGG